MGGWVFFVLGTIAGSVANAVIYRLPSRISWWQGRSTCPQCKHTLAWYDLIPLLSFVLLRGKCRYCHKSIGLRYLSVELIMALGFVAIVNYQLSIINLAILWITVVIVAMDWETMLVSDWLVGIWAITVIGYRLSVIGLSLNSALVGILIGVAVIGGIWAISKGRAMGFGDVEIAAVIGLWLGWPIIIPALWIAFVVGAIVGVIRLWRGTAKLKSQIAFGPFLILGGWIAYLVQLKYVFPF